jgi:hypothetical protein
MARQSNANFRPSQFGEDALAASRKVWLASLGAAAMTRDWVQSEARDRFESLVKEGTIVESRAVTFVGDRLETSMNRANTLWRQTRRTVESTVKQAADTAVALAQKALPRTLPKVALPIATKPVASARKPRSTRTAKTVRKGKRAVKRAK